MLVLGIDKLQSAKLSSDELLHAANSSQPLSVDQRVEMRMNEELTTGSSRRQARLIKRMVGLKTDNQHNDRKNTSSGSEISLDICTPPHFIFSEEDSNSSHGEDASRNSMLITNIQALSSPLKK